MMEKYFLFGAGINCYGVIHFFRKESIIAIIDSDIRKQGTDVEGIPVISLDEYIKSNHKEQIIISGFIEGDSIAECLRKNNISNYYKSPYMQNGFYSDSKDIIYKLNLQNSDEIVFCNPNPISRLIERDIKKINKKVDIKYIDDCNCGKVSENAPIVVTNSDEKLFVEKHLGKMFKNQMIIDINEEYRKNYGFKNEKIKKIKNIHKNRRCFIIGNGPSLRYQDLEQLYAHKEICFGVNRIYLAYQHTNWRPDYYVAVDYMVIQNDLEKIREMEGTKFIRHFYKSLPQWDDEEIYEFRGIDYKAANPQISFDMYQGIYMGNTVVFDAIQIALYMGFQEIYLLGVDMSSGIRCEDKESHFYELTGRKEVFGTSNTSEARNCLKYAAEEMEKKGIKLRNATRGGELNEVLRVDFDSLF